MNAPTPAPTSTRLRHAAPLLLALLLWPAAPTRAQDAQDPQGAPPAAAPSRAAIKEARSLKAQGDGAMEALRYQEALDHYSRSQALDPKPALHYNRGRALEALERFPEAVDALQRFEAEASRRLKRKVPQLETLLSELRNKVGTLQVNSQPPGASVRVRGTVVGTTPLSPLRMSVGKAAVELTLDGHEPFAREVDVTPAATTNVEAALVPLVTTGVLTVVSAVAGARVEVDGQPRGSAPTETELPAGEHTIVVSKEGYKSVQLKAIVAVGERKQLDVVLEAEAGLLSQWWLWAAVGVAVAGTVAISVALTTEGNTDKGDIPPGQVAAPLVRF